MVSDIGKHPTHYSVLALLVSVALLLFVASWPNASLQMLAVIFATTSYVLWGLIHHHILKDLTLEIVLEYLIVALLVLSVFWVILI